MISKYLSILLMATATLNPLSLAEELSPSANAEPPTQNSQLPTVPNFRLLDQNGRSHELYRCAEAPAVVLYTYGLGCPIVRQSAPNLWRIQEEFEPKGVRFFLLNANAGDTRDEITADAQEFAIQAPILQDEAQAVTRALGSKRTAEAILIDPKSGWKIVYRGAVDDRFDYGAQKQNAEHEWLRDALTAHLSGQPITQPQSQTKGCLINLIEPTKLSYSQDIAPILESKCVVCHVQGGIGPFAMSSHKKLKGWSKMIREVVLTKQMPPWHADPAYNQFENDRSLTPEEERRLLAWLDAGAPKEETEPDPLAETKAIDTAEWVLGQPDVIVQIPEVQTLPAEGAFEYRYFYVPTGLTEDKWVKAVDVQPTNRAVLHHALVFVIYPDQYAHIQPEVRGGLNGYFAAFLPGTKIKPYPEGTGQFLPAGALLVFQMHYNATGKEEQDQTRLGLYFHDAPPPRALMIQAAHETEFEIPPNTEDFPTRADWQAPQDVEVYGLSPHMHYRGSRFTFAAHTPDGQEQVLLNVPHYVFDWQPMYMFQKPIVLPANTVIGCDGAFDNSKFNPRNPDPSQTVTFGEQSWEEMFIGYITFSAPRDDNYFKPQEVKQYPPITEENLGGTEWRMGRRFTLTFNADKTISVRGQAAGMWEIKDGRLHIEGFGRHLEAIIYGDDLLVDGRRLRRVEPGEEPPREPREQVSSNR